MTFASQRAAALALLTNHATVLTLKSAKFLGQLAVSQASMSVAQKNWLAALLEQANLPPYSETERGGQRPEATKSRFRTSRL